MKLAAIDIGSNSIKLVVVDAAASDSFAVLAREKETVRLGHETLREGYLSPDAIERAAECVKRFRSIAEARGAERVLAIATASVRAAANASEFIDEIERMTGVRVEVLSGVEEARLIGLAATQGCAAPAASLINVDIGGGSTEISLVRGGVPVALYSVRLGAVGLTERFIASDPPKAKELRALREEVRGALERPSRELRDAGWQRVTGTSGTIIAIGEALHAQDSKQKSQGAQPAGAEIVLSRLERFNERMAGLTQAERRGVHGFSAQRAEIIVAGGQILEAVMRSLSINCLRTCDWALREGVIIDFLREVEAESKPPLPDDADPRLRGVHAVGRRFGYEESHAHQVARFAEAIFDEVAQPAGLTRNHRTLLAAAALLHDVGYHIAHEGHHKHALYLIRNSELTGFSEAERDVIANVARYHRGSTPKEKHHEFYRLNEADRDTVRSLAAILRVADALDRSHEGRVRALSCAREDQKFQLTLACEDNCEREAAAAESKSGLFEEVFNCELSVGVNGISSDSEKNMATAEEIEGVDCEAGVIEGIRAVLRGRLVEMYDLRAAALEWEDIEGVHRMRVASRRLRSALRDFEDFLSGNAVPQRRLKEVADALGEVRDQDVAIAALEKVRTKAGGDVAEGIGQLISERDAVRVRERERLEAVIAETPLAELREKFLSRLERVGVGGRQKKKGKRGRGARKVVSFRQAGREVIKSRLEELRKFSNSLHHPFEVEPLHEMRIAAKRLRYALEMFASCWGGRLSSCSREVAELQTSLGELRDCDLWIEDLGARLDRHRDESEGGGEQTADSRIRLAAIWLLNHFTKERSKHFRRALARWHKWETGGFFERMGELLEDAQTAEAEAPASKYINAADAGADGEGTESESAHAAKESDAN